MHLLCFILLFVAKVFPSGRGNRVLLNWKLLKALMSFITIPYYIYIICFAFKTLDKQFITFSSDSTKDLYAVVDPIYIAEKYGNGILWIKVEIFAFYCNLFVCFLYLAKARCTSTEDTTQQDYGYMVVCQDWTDSKGSEDNKIATNVRVFDVEGSSGRDKLKEHLGIKDEKDFTANKDLKKRLIWGKTIA
jgi:hypothetical protein